MIKLIWGFLAFFDVIHGVIGANSRAFTSRRYKKSAAVSSPTFWSFYYRIEEARLGVQASEALRDYLKDPSITISDKDSASIDSASTGVWSFPVLWARNALHQSIQFNIELTKAALSETPFIDLCIFRDDIQPAWEDPRNFIIKEIHKMNSDHAIALIDAFLKHIIHNNDGDATKVNGIYIRRRGSSFKVQTWLNRIAGPSRIKFDDVIRQTIGTYRASVFSVPQWRKDKQEKSLQDAAAAASSSSVDALFPEPQALIPPLQLVDNSTTISMPSTSSRRSRNRRNRSKILRNETEKKQAQRETIDLSTPIPGGRAITIPSKKVQTVDESELQSTESPTWSLFPSPASGRASE